MSPPRALLYQKRGDSTIGACLLRRLDRPAGFSRRCSRIGIEQPCMTVPFPFPPGLSRREIRFDLDGRALIVTAAADLEDLLLTDREIEKPPYWAVLWPAGAALAAHLRTQRDLVRKVTLELGCGAGLPGIVARLKGARVLQTDLFPEAVLLARWNARRNGVGGIRYLAMDWLHWSLRREFDRVLAADVL